MEMDLEPTMGPKHRHVLSLSYPDLTLLPPNASLHLEPPKDLEYRQRPECKQPVISFDYAVVLPEVLHGASTQPKNQFEGFIRFVDLLAGSRGTTDLRAVTYRSSLNSGVEMVVGLKTCLNSGVERVSIHHLDSSQYPLLAAQGSGSPWVKLLLDLLTRASDCAYEHVIERLEASLGYDAATLEESSWAAQWGSKYDSTLTARSLFLQRLRRIGVDETCRTSTPLHLFESLQGQTLNLLLPCGHEMLDVAGDVLEATSETDLLTATCSQCPIRIMTAGDHQRLALSKAARERDSFHFKEESWRELDVPAELSNVPLCVPGMGIIEALYEARRSLAPPESMVLAEICPARFEETSFSLTAFCNLIEASAMIEETPYNAYVAMGQHLDKSIRENGRLPDSWPPAWQGFVESWLRRTINLLHKRRCHKENHSGVHWHSGLVVFYSSQLADAAEFEGRHCDGDESEDDSDHSTGSESDEDDNDEDDDIKKLGMALDATQLNDA